MTTVPKPADMTTGYKGIWDAWNRLMALKSTDGSKIVTANIYDGLNRRIIRKSYDSSGTLTETRFFFYSDQWQILEERGHTPTVPDRQWVWGIRYIDDCVLRDRASTDPRRTPLRPARRQLERRCPLRPNRAAIVERYAYSPYGVVQFLDASFAPITGNVSAYGWETLYSGYCYDGVTGNYNVRYRELQPILGIWLSRDPLSWLSLLSLYQYTSGVPTSRLDPLGLDDHHWLAQLNGIAQAKYVTPLCTDHGIPVSIHDFTTTLDGPIKGGKHDPTRTAHSAVEYVVGYNQIAKTIYETLTTCCQLLVSFDIAITAAWAYLNCFTQPEPLCRD